MAITWWIGNAVPNEGHPLWKMDVAPTIKEENCTGEELFSDCFDVVSRSAESMARQSEKPEVSMLADAMFVQFESCWLRIGRDGTIEFGEAAA